MLRAYDAAMDVAGPTIAGIEEITAAYRKLLGRLPDEAGMQTHLEAKLSPEALERSIMLSPEFRARQLATEEDIVSAYRMLLGRDPDEGGLRTHLEAKLSPEALAQSIMLSPEFRARQLALKTVVVYGLEFVVPTNELMYYGDYEPHVFRELMKRMQPGVTFLDVGANIGLFAVHAAKRGASVIAIEARPSNIGLLLNNARRNHVSVEVHPLAASAKAGYAVLQLSEKHKCRNTPD